MRNKPPHDRQRHLRPPHFQFADTGDQPMLSETVTPTMAHTFAPDARTLPVMLQYFDITSFSGPVAATAMTGNSSDDGYLLVLLADQEIAEGRSEQAHALLDAAYSAFDRIITNDESAIV
jgi:hypothetical protein